MVICQYPAEGRFELRYSVKTQLDLAAISEIEALLSEAAAQQEGGEVSWEFAANENDKELIDD